MCIGERDAGERARRKNISRFAQEWFGYWKEYTSERVQAYANCAEQADRLLMHACVAVWKVRNVPLTPKTLNSHRRLQLLDPETLNPKP
jgi:hypothetical protein